MPGPGNAKLFTGLCNPSFTQIRDRGWLIIHTPLGSLFLERHRLFLEQGVILDPSQTNFAAAKSIP